MLKFIIISPQSGLKGSDRRRWVLFKLSRDCSYYGWGCRDPQWTTYRLLWFALSTQITFGGPHNPLNLINGSQTDPHQYNTWNTPFFWMILPSIWPGDYGHMRIPKWASNPPGYGNCASRSYRSPPSASSNSAHLLRRQSGLWFWSRTHRCKPNWTVMKYFLISDGMSVPGSLFWSTWRYAPGGSSKPMSSPQGPRL